jgi:hypothetical protein
MDLLDLIIDENGDLELKPGSDFNRENFGHMTDMPTDSFLVEILESFLCNGWE